MKKFLALILACAFLTACESAGGEDSMGKISARKIDEIVITYSSDAGSAVIEDRDTIKELCAMAQDLRFELDTELTMSLTSMYTLKFIDGDKVVHYLNFDGEGAFWYDDKAGNYVLTEGEVSYDEIERLYEENYVDENATEDEDDFILE
ncbi:MAG: hypothetical protein LUG52_06270 [Clostridia bacterium]|nr:hypothetical protein [Clostridia bacterium]